MQLIPFTMIHIILIAPYRGCKAGGKKDAMLARLVQHAVSRLNTHSNTQAHSDNENDECGNAQVST